MTFTAARPTDVQHAAAERTPEPEPQPEFQLVESSSGWQLTLTLTDRLRAALAGEGASDEEISLAVHIKPNLVPGEPFPARLRVADPASEASAARGRGAHEAADDRETRPRPQPA